MLSNEFPASVNSVLGTCQAMGLLVDSKEIAEIMSDVREGKYDALIQAQKTEVDPEKVTELKEFFSEVDAAQVAEKAALDAEAAEKSE